MLDVDKDRILKRVKKMMALANDDGATEGERDNALRMAHATLAKYNLTMMEADESGKEKRVEDAVESRDWPWARTMSHAIAHLFFCDYFYTRMGRGKVKHYFVGRADNVITAQEMMRYVERGILKESARYARNGGFAPRDFCKGASHQVYHHCQQLRKDAEASSAAAPTVTSSGTALVLASLYDTEKAANCAFLEACGRRLKSAANREHRANSSAYSAGSAYGKSISLHRQVGDTHVRGRLK